MIDAMMPGQPVDADLLLRQATNHPLFDEMLRKVDELRQMRHAIMQETSICALTSIPQDGRDEVFARYDALLIAINEVAAKVEALSVPMQPVMPAVCGVAPAYRR